MKRCAWWTLALLAGVMFVGCSAKPAPEAKSGNEEVVDPIADAVVPASGEVGVDDAASVTPAVEETTTTADTKPAPEPMPEPAPTEKPEPAAAADSQPKPLKVKLGSPELTGGIPGEGPLTVEQISAWLDQPDKHLPLEVELPLGLSLGASAIKIPADNPMTLAKIELGRQLYFDKRLSADATVSCADCHHPDEGYGRATQFGVGIGGQTGNRNSPVSYNRILSDAQFWDGRAGSLEEQAVGPIANPIEMGNTHDVAVETVRNIEGYRLQFEKIFSDGVNIDNIGRAIATFERAIVTGPSPFDYYEPLANLEKAFAADLEDLDSFKEESPELYEKYIAAREASEANPMTESAKRGRELFFSQKAGCTACHVGPNLTDEKYHNLGVGMDAAEPDLGRFAVTNEEKDRGAFKTPTIRNVALTAPYMHDGSQKTLAEVVEWYAKGGHPNPTLSEAVRKLDLTDQDKADLVAFMEACTGEFPPMETGRLPE
ncbi:MAG: cytochrome c peroxidase [Pirellulaceae bacterium]